MYSSSVSLRTQKELSICTVDVCCRLTGKCQNRSCFPPVPMFLCTKTVKIQQVCEDSGFCDWFKWIIRGVMWLAFTPLVESSFLLSIFPAMPFLVPAIFHSWHSGLVVKNKCYFDLTRIEEPVFEHPKAAPTESWRTYPECEPLLLHLHITWSPQLGFILDYTL